jgi:hypothetical protein
MSGITANSPLASSLLNFNTATTTMNLSDPSLYSNQNSIEISEINSTQDATNFNDALLLNSLNTSSSSSGLSTLSGDLVAFDILDDEIEDLYSFYDFEDPEQLFDILA